MLIPRKNHPFPSFDDIVFENRNRSYGAYALRRSYDRHIMKGFLLTISLLLLLVGQGIIRDYFFPDQLIIENDVPSTIEIDTRIIETPDKPVETSKGEKPPKGQQTQEKVIPIVVPIDSVRMNEVVDTTSGPSTGSQLGSGPAVPSHGGDTLGSAAGQGTSKLIEQVIIDTPDTMPEFPGGQAGLFSFLKSKLRYPRIPLEEKIETTVYVAFVVRPEGNITDIEVLRPAGYGFDEEVIRVIQKMPDWKPGKMQGKKVPVRFRMPIKFRLQK